MKKEKKGRKALKTKWTRPIVFQLCSLPTNAKKKKIYKDKCKLSEVVTVMRKEGAAFVLPNGVSLSSRLKHLHQQCEISEITKTHLLIVWKRFALCAPEDRFPDVCSLLLFRLSIWKMLAW